MGFGSREGCGYCIQENASETTKKEEAIATQKVITGFDWAFEQDDLNDALAAMLRVRISETDPFPEGFRSLLARAGWLATYLSSSRSHRHRQKALLFAALSKQLFPTDSVLETVSYTIFARTGTLPAAMHLDFVAGEHNQFIGPSLGPLNLEFAASFNESFSTLGGGVTLTEFQRQMEIALVERAAGVISAPTSAGKSFIVHEHVKGLISSGEFVGLFIVPTKALIAQTCALYRRFRALTGVKLTIASSVNDDMIRVPGSMVLALTQERCVRLLRSPLAKEINFIFADEIQSLEAGDRGALLEYVLHALIQLAPKAKLFAAGPFIDNGAQLGSELFGRPCVPLDTEDTPVSQMILKISPTKGVKAVDVTVMNETGEKEVRFDLPVSRVMYSRWRNNHGLAIADCLNVFSAGGTSIVYAPGQATARNWAEKYVESVASEVEPTEETSDLCDFIAESIHSQCSLIHFLKRRVAYHHAALPDFVREEIEGLFADGALDVLFCTSTLLEGVNLPAEKVFVLSPEKGDAALTTFEFRNLIGRAGRLDQHLCGLVYCIQVPSDDELEWVDKYRDRTKKTVQPTIETKLNSDFESIIAILGGGMPVTEDSVPDSLRGTIIILRSRYLRSPEDVAKYLDGKKLTAASKQRLLEALQVGAQSITIPASVALQNPSVDPVLQSRLFEKVKSNPSAWTIRREKGRATDLENVFKQLDEIFAIIDEIDPIGHPKYYRDDLLMIARLWLDGKPFREIVIRAIPRNRRQANDVSRDEADAAITRAMEMISTEIGFITSKYFSVLADILRHLVPADTGLAPFGFVLSLPAMLELGCSDKISLALATACIPRAAVIRVAPLIPADVEDPVGWLSKNEVRVRPRLSRIFVKILRRSGIWPLESKPE